MTRSELLEQLMQAVQRMRTAQREYFRTRSDSALEQARTQERQVDALLVSLADRQCSLFGE